MRKIGCANLCNIFQNYSYSYYKYIVNRGVGWQFTPMIFPHILILTFFFSCLSKVSLSAVLVSMFRCRGTNYGLIFVVFIFLDIYLDVSWGFLDCGTFGFPFAIIGLTYNSSHPLSFVTTSWYTDVLVFSSFSSDSIIFEPVF